MTEIFLHYVWQHRHFDFLNARTTKGKLINIKHTGIYNTNAGPDFTQAIIEIDDITWVGNVEIHIKSSDWFKHKHHTDGKYKSVILHVVYESDMDVIIDSNYLVPTLELKNLISLKMFDAYKRLIMQPDILLCRNYLPNVDSLILTSQLSSLLIERILKKTKQAQSVLEICKYDWNELIYRVLAKTFGCKTNSYAFEFLTQNLPYKIISKHSDSLLQLDALFFGVAGFLQESDGSEYMEKLMYEYAYLKHKYGLISIDGSCWNMLRLRPQNFPTIRIAQFSALMHNTKGFISDWVLGADVESLKLWLMVSPDDYWQTHYRFGKSSAKHSVSLGEQTIFSIFINTIILLRFLYAKNTGNNELQEKALRLYEYFPFENNKTTRVVKDSAFKLEHSGDSQAIMELLTQYCLQKRCLKCAIGEKIVREIYQM